MEASSTYLKFSCLRFFHSLVLVPLLLFSAGLAGEVMGQERVYAEVSPSSGRNGATFVAGLGLFGSYTPTNNDAIAQVSAAAAAGDGDEDTYATLSAGNLNVLLAQTSGEAWVQPKFEVPVDAGGTTYVRIGELAVSGITVDLLDIVGGLLGLLDNNIIIPEVYAAASATSVGNKIDDANVESTIVVDGQGNTYLAITSSQSYNSVRVKLRNQGNLLGLSLGSRFSLDVYDAFTFDDPTCGPAMFTDLGQTTGITVSLGDVIQNPELAVDNDASTHSTITTGTLNLLGSVFQNFYFDGRTAPQDYFKITFKIGGGSLLDLNLLGNFEVRAYNGDNVVYTKKLQGALVNGLDLLTLLESGDPITVPFAPGVPFDRVAIGINTTVALNLASSPLEVYHVERYGLGDSPLACVDPEPPLADEGDDHILGLNRECADVLVGHEYVNFPYNAIDGDPGTFAVLEATSGSLLEIGSYSGNIELGYQANVPANTTSYLKIDMGDEGLLSSLLDGSLGGLLGGTLDNVLFGDHYFDIQVNDENGDEVLAGSSANAFNGLPIRIVQDKFGAYYVAITPTSAYRSVKITEHFPALVGAEASRTMKVYSLCYSTGSEDCEQAFSTYSETTGISLDLLGLGKAGVTDAHLAIDDDDLSVEGDETFSEISIGTAGIGTSVFQYVDFHALSSPADYFKVKVGFENGGLLDVELLNNIEIRAYNGDELVYQQRLQNGLVAGLDILGLLSAENEVTIPIGPGKAFDRVAIGISSLVDLAVLENNPLRLYSIKRFGVDCPDPNPLPNNPETESPFNEEDCSVELGEFENVNFAYNAIDGDIDSYATISAGSGVVLGAGGYDGYIEMGYAAPVPAGETSYIRIDMEDEGLLDALVGGSLGNLLATVGDVLVFGNHYFDLSVRDADGEEIYNESGNGGFSNNNVRIVQDKFGRYYIAFTADEEYQSVRITLHNDAVAGLDGVTTMNVYSMCRETVFDPCEQATFTSFDGSGITLDLLQNANPAGVSNPQFVIDDNNSNYAEFSFGGGTIDVGVLPTLYQDIYFKTKVTTTATDKVRLRMQIPDALLDVGLLEAYTVYLYDGDTQVDEITLGESALISGLDLFGLLNSGGRINVEFVPEEGITYDRVRFEISGLASVGIANPVRLYSVYRISDACPDPEFEQPPFEVCADDIVDEGENVDDIQNLTDGNHNSYATIRSDAGIIGNLGAYSGHLELGFGAVVPAGTSSYIRIGYEEEILNSLLAGSIGDLVNGVLEGVALGDHYFNVIVNDADGGEVVRGSSQDLFDEANGQIRLVQDTKGRYYLEITPTSDYQSVRLEDHTTALLGLGLSEGHLDVYGMCHTPTTFECPAAIFTSYEGEGLTADVLGIGNGGVQNPFWAIDQNTSSASTLSLGTVSLLPNAMVQQNIQFDRVLTAGDPIQVKMKVGDGTLNLDILGALEVVGYLDGQEVYSESFDQAFVEANIADVLNDSEPAIVTLKPDQDIDEIAFRLSNLASVGVGPDVSIYYVIPLCESVSGSYLEVTKDGAVADGVEENEVTATILNQDGDAVTNTAVDFSVVNVDGTTDTETVTTDNDGKARLSITSTVAGEAQIDATVEGTTITKLIIHVDGDPTNNDPDNLTEGTAPAVVTFVAGPVDYDKSNLAVTKDNAVADGVDYNEFTATIMDAFENLIAGEDVVFNITNPDGSTGTETVTTDADGKAVIQPTSTKAGVVTVEARVDGTEINNSPADATFVAGDIDYDKSNIEVLRTGAVADGVDENSVRVNLLDAFDNPVSGADVEYTVTGLADVETSSLTGVSDADGRFVLTLTSEKIGTASITATAEGTAITVGSPAEVTFVAGPVDYGKSSLAVTKDNAVADGVDYNEFTATIMDAFENVIAGEDVVFNITHPDGSTGTETVTTDADGKAVIQPTSKKAGMVTVEARVDGTEINNSPAGATFVIANNISVEKESDEDVVKAGEETTFTITLTNDGPVQVEPGKEIKLTERPGTGVTIIDYEVISGAATVAGNGNSATVTTNAVIPVGGTITLRVTATVAADAGEEINNGVTVWGPDKDPQNDPEDDRDDMPPVPVVRESALAIEKMPNDARVVAGGSTSFTVTITNEGPSVIASGEVISLGERPATGLTITGYEVTSGNAAVAGSGNSAEVTTTAEIALGGTITLTVTADVDANAPAEVSNGIDVWGPDKDPENDPKDDDHDTPPIPVDRESNLSIEKLADDQRVIAGRSTSFTVTVTNNGPSAIASGEVIRIGERPTEGLTITGYEVTSGNATVAGSGNSAEITTTADIAVGGTITLTITADVDADAPAEVGNGIDVWGPDKDPENDPKDDDHDTDPIPVDRESNMTIEKVADEDRVQAGESTTFTVTVTNSGPSVIEAGKDISLAERPGSGVTITGYEVTSGAATVAGNGNTAVLTTTGKIAIGGTIVVKVTAAIDANAGETITNGISVWGPGKNPDDDQPDDEGDTPEIPVDHESNLSIVKVADQDRVQAGASTTFTLTITNNGPAVIASGDVISLGERPGNGVTITGYEVTSGNGTAAGNGNSAEVTTSANIAVGGTIVVKVSADIAANAGETITNGISVWGPDKDPGTDTPDDEDDTPEIPVDHVSTLSIEKVADDERVITGGTTSFTVTVTNNGPAAIAAGETIAVEERPSDGLAITGYEVTSGNATVSGSGNTPQLTTTAAIAVGGTITFVVSADVTAPAGAEISNGIAVWGPDKNPGTDEEDDETETPDIPVDRPYTLSIEKVADQSLVTAGEATTFTVTVTNNGPLDIEAGRDIALRERPGMGVTITGYEIISGAATVSGSGNSAILTTTGVVGAGATVEVRITANVEETATGTITNGISVWGPDSNPDTDEPDDEDDTNPIPVDATLEIPNVFTPNGDGLNDRFVIKNLMQYSGRELTVVNRWGNQVYRSDNYNNDWDGGSLAEGTYYFILRYRNGGEWKTEKGPVAIIRVTNR